MSASALANRCALVTGASSGIGRSVAELLARSGTRLCLLGRDVARLATVQNEIGRLTPLVHARVCDLEDDRDVAAVGEEVRGLFQSRLDILIHCAGALSIAPLESVAMAALDAHYRVNVRAPLLLTQALLPLLKAAQGQIVFVNSSLGTRIKEGAGAYAASKHALKAIADTLRAEIEGYGVRVLSAFPGNTATPMQERVCRDYDKPFRPQAMLQPHDVAAAIVNALLLPANAALTELHILPARR